MIAPHIPKHINHTKYFSNLWFFSNIIIKPNSLPKTAALSRAIAFLMSIFKIHCKKNCVTILHHHTKFQYISHRNIPIDAISISIVVYYSPNFLSVARKSFSKSLGTRAPTAMYQISFVATFLYP